MKSYLRWSLLTALAVGLSSCQDPAYKAKQAVREAHIDRDAMLYLTRERAGPEHLEALAELDKELQKRYAERLKKTLKMIQKRQERDHTRWIEMRPLREEQLRKLMEGKPEDIPEVWGKMTY